MIYTSYFAKLRKIPNNIIRINIARVLPPNVDMICYPNLYPTSNILYRYKHDDIYTQNDYIYDYEEVVLDKIDPLIVQKELMELSKGKDVVLVCYEKSEDFCHRHLVSEWFNDYNIYCKEWEE